MGRKGRQCDRRSAATADSAREKTGQDRVGAKATDLLVGEFDKPRPRLHKTGPWDGVQPPGTHGRDSELDIPCLETPSVS